MKSLLLHPQARRELDNAIHFYEVRSKGLGLEFLAEIEQTLDKIYRNPNLGTFFLQSNIRRLLVNRFPYSIFYTERETTIWIIAIAHAKRQPDYWKKRKI